MSFEIPDTPAALLRAAWNPSFPTPELLGQAVALLPVVHYGTQESGVLDEGPRSFIRIGPGAIRLGQRDFARAQRSAERALHRRQVDVELLAAYVQERGEFPGAPTPTRVISQWSRRSRARMIETIGLLDFSPLYAEGARLPAMLTLTYPRCWLTVAPNGAAVKRHLKALRKRYRRAWGEDLATLWKLEFQGRDLVQRCSCEHCGDLDDGRAPHVHMMITEPNWRLQDGRDFRTWVSETWVEIVDHPDPEQRRRHLGAGTAVDTADGLSMRDPKRVAVYFAKHGIYAAKDYQHRVPLAWQEPGQGPGRFWGYWGLEKVTVTAVVSEYTRLMLGRLLRRWARAQGTTRRVRNRRARRGQLRPAYAEVQSIAGAQLVRAREEDGGRLRYSRTRTRRMGDARGFVMVNSGPEMLSQLARYLDQVDQDVLFR